jgi:prepilin-type N-terminal cleavage/methylation domain-containing protein
VQKSWNINSPSQRGFSLLEVLIAIAILSFGLIALTKMQHQATKSNFSSKRMNSSIFLATGEVERIAGADYDNATDTDGDGNAGLGDTGANADSSSSFIQNGHRYDLFVNVSEDDPINNAKSINVIVMQNNNIILETPYILRD